MLRIFILSLAAFSVLARDCKIKIEAGDRYAHIYFDVFRWTRPKHTLGSVSTIKDGSVVEFSCKSGFVTNDLIASMYNFQCTNGYFNKTLEYEDLLCRASHHELTETVIVPSVQLVSSIFKCDQRNWELIQVQTKKPDGSSRHLYSVCYDKKVMNPKFVFQPSSKESPVRINATRKDVWALDRFGDFTYDKVKLAQGYVSNVQEDRLTKAFPDKYNARHKYPYIFHRGHLAPYADFIYLEDKKASCEYINAAPQWKELNSHSWSMIEREARDLVRSNPNEWEIYTGTYGTIPTTKGPLYISTYETKDGKTKKPSVPVPRLFWKVVFNKKNKDESKVFVGINNPELRSPSAFDDKYVICSPILYENGSKFKGNEFTGFVYRCPFREFLSKLKTVEKIVK